MRELDETRKICFIYTALCGIFLLCCFGEFFIFYWAHDIVIYTVACGGCSQAGRRRRKINKINFNINVNFAKHEMNENDADGP